MNVDFKSETVINGISKKKTRKKKNKSRSRQSKRTKKKKSLSASRNNFEFRFPKMTDWFWSNYKKATEWQHKHQIAYWKSYALALQSENQVLYDFIQNVCVKGKDLDYFKIPKSKNSFYRSNGRRSVNFPPDTSSGSNEHEQSEGDGSHLEVSNELVDFFEQKFLAEIREKEQQLASSRNEQEDSDDNTKPPSVQVGLERTKEMKILYGEGSAMITGMETALQLSFDRFCDIKSPKYWPNISFKC